MKKARLKEEIIRCGRDPAYFIKKYVKIRHPVRGLIPFNLFEYQEKLLSNYLRNRFNVILKARQLGISEITAAYAAWMMIFHRDKSILVIATKMETAKNMVRKVKTTMENVPEWLMISPIDIDNKLSIELRNKSTIKAVASSGDAGRSEALSLLIVDEAAFIDNMEELWTGLLPTVQAGGRVIMLSTPNGVGNVFHKVYSEAEIGANDFKSTRIMWWEHPERNYGLEDDLENPGFKTSEWFRKETRNMTEREIAQELCCNFNSSGDTVIGIEGIRILESMNVPPLYMENQDRRLFIWKRPQPNKKYFISADVARGDGKDNSAFHVWDVDDMTQVAEYYGQVPPDAFAEILCRTGEEYGNCLLVIENNSIGLACLEHVKMRKYPNVYFSRKGDIKSGEAVNTAYENWATDLVPGFTTSAKTRPLIINKLEELIRLRMVTINSKRFLVEARTFIWYNGHAQAMKGYNDDLIMSAAIGAWIKDTFITPNYANLDMQRKMIQGMSMNKTVNTDIHGASKDPTYVPRQRLGMFSQNPATSRQMVVGKNTVIDLSFLYDKKK